MLRRSGGGTEWFSAHAGPWRCMQGVDSVPRLQTKLYSLVLQRMTGKLPAKVRQTCRCAVRCLALLCTVTSRPRGCHAGHQVQLESIESGDVTEYVPNDDDIAKTVTVVKRVADSIRARKFDATPSSSGCKACAFQRSCRAAAVSPP